MVWSFSYEVSVFTRDHLMYQRMDLVQCCDILFTL